MGISLADFCKRFWYFTPFVSKNTFEYKDIFGYGGNDQYLDKSALTSSLSNMTASYNDLMRLAKNVFNSQSDEDPTLMDRIYAKIEKGGQCKENLTP